MADNLPEPASRKEEYLATAAGMTGIELPEPASREEQYLNAIAQNGGGGGGGYTLPTASASTLGGVKVGENLSIDANGVLSAEGGDAGGVTVLTSEMYNYPTDNPTGIALWLLDPGIYVYARGDTTTKVWRSRDWSTTGIVNGTATFLVCQKDRSNYVKVLSFNAYPNTDMATGAQDAISITDINTNSGSLRGGRHDVLTTEDVKDTLTSTETHIPLSANQGRVLKALIDASGATTLTSANYNYPVNNPTGIAGWLLADGEYKYGEDGLTVYGGDVGGPENYAITGSAGSKIDVISSTSGSDVYKVIHFEMAEVNDFYIGYTSSLATNGGDAKIAYTNME